MSELRQVGPNEWVSPEDMGVTPHLSYSEYAKKHYKRGQMMHEQLMPGEHVVSINYNGFKRHNSVYDKSHGEHLGEYFDAFSAGGNEAFLDMRLQSSHSRGNILYGMLLAVFLWGGYKCVSAWAWGSAAWALNGVDQLILSLFALIMLIGFFRPVVLPIRFHKKNQEVYVKHKGVLYRIPWNACELAVVYKSFYLGAARVKDTYLLVMWLNPKYAVNKDITDSKHACLVLNEAVGEHVSSYAYYEYVRRYMTGDEPFAMTLQTEARLPKRVNDILNQYGPIRAQFHHYFFSFLNFLLKPSPYVLKLAPIKDKWPEEVHEWTGERCNWI